MAEAEGHPTTIIIIIPSLITSMYQDGSVALKRKHLLVAYSVHVTLSKFKRRDQKMIK